MSDEPRDDLLLEALFRYLEESLDVETSLRELLRKTGHDNPDLPLEECVSNIVRDHLRLMTS